MFRAATGAMKRLTLTFDNGPDPTVTPGVLDTLAQHGIKSTFFVCGNHAGRAPQRELLTRAKVEGHRIGNHTFTHSIEFGRSTDPTLPEREIGETQEILGDLADQDRLFRPYGGGGVLGNSLLNPAAVEFLCRGGYTCVLWNSVPRDWELVTEWPERALTDIRRQDWTVVVLHDIGTGAMDQLPRFLDAARAANVEIVADFPDACVPIFRGEKREGLSDYVATTGPARD